MDALEVLRWFNLIAFSVLALVTARLWWRRRDRSSRWAFVTFFILAAVSATSRLLPQHSDAPQVSWARHVLIAVLLAFPFALYRLSASFRMRRSWFDWIALAAAAGLIGWVFTIPRLPEEGDPWPPGYGAFVAAILVYWVVLSTVVAMRLWRAGKDTPPVARKRMRMLSMASVALSLALVIAGSAGERQTYGTRAVTQLIALASLVGFFVAFSPPRWLRAMWRRPSEEALRRAMLDLMSATSAEHVMDVLLPHAIEIVGGEGIAVLDRDGKVVGSRGMDPATLARTADIPALLGDHSPAAPRLVHLEFPFGALIVQAAPYTPFFGQDEVELLGVLGTVANLALDRVAAEDLRLQLSQAQIRRQQALEINDNVVQGLAIAKYSFDLGQTDKAREAVEGTLVAARKIISELLDELGDADFGPGTLTRGDAASGFMDSDITRQRRESEGAEPGSADQ